MRRSTKIMAATAIALSISGLGATNALALDEETGCSDIANFAICLLTEDDDDSLSTIASADDDDSIWAFLGQSRSDNQFATLLDVQAGDVAATAGQFGLGDRVVTGAGATIDDEDGNETYAVAYTDENGDSSAVVVLVGQDDDGGNRATGVVSTNDDCAIFFGGEYLTDCPVEPGTVAPLSVPYINLP